MDEFPVVLVQYGNCSDLTLRPTELLSRGSYNVISVDWEYLSVSPWYPQAVLHTQLVSDALCPMPVNNHAGVKWGQILKCIVVAGLSVCG